MKKLFMPYTKGALQLKNRVVMAPMTRSRALNNVPLTVDTAEAKLQDGSADLVAFGKSFLANPDFMKRVEKKAPLNNLDAMTLYSPGEQGYTDYPVLD
jgi:2,4-dienoyl-CoA reductase-like NADH-dependent reductase (Old Yellow Enzyme family)